MLFEVKAGESLRRFLSSVLAIKTYVTQIAYLRRPDN
jgi:hypothetical protein